MLWVLRDGQWAITWEVFCHWGLPLEVFTAQSPGCTHPRHLNGYPLAAPDGGAVDWHSPTPFYEGHGLAIDDCPWTGAPCYMDTGFTIGGDLFDQLRIEGGEAVWTRLQELLDTRRNETETN